MTIGTDGSPTLFRMPAQEDPELAGAQLSELLAAARQVLAPTRLNAHFDFGGVGAALLSVSGAMYSGVCVDTSCSMGMCAEVNAASTMLTAGESVVVAMVAVGPDGQVVPPCGKCREFISQMGSNPVVIVAEGTFRRLSELLPFDWKPGA